MKTTVIILCFLTLGAFGQSLGEALQFLAPTADQFGGDFRVEDRLDGQGERVTFWNVAKLGPLPTLSKINQAKIDLAAQRQAEQTARQQELSLLDSARTKLANNQDLTAAELRAVLRALIRRTTTGANAQLAPRP